MMNRYNSKFKLHMQEREIKKLRTERDRLEKQIEAFNLLNDSKDSPQERFAAKAYVEELENENKRLKKDLEYWQSEAHLLSGWKEPLEKAIKNLNIDNIKISEKIKNQRAEITRLLAENKRLKAENGNSLWNIEQARAEGQNEAWELAQRICSPDGYSHAELKEIFNFQVGATEIFQSTYPEAAAKVYELEKAKEKPQKTMLQDFLEKYPKAPINNSGTPEGICPHDLGYEYYRGEKCNDKCVDCWNRPLEQIETGGK